MPPQKPLGDMSTKTSIIVLMKNGARYLDELIARVADQVYHHEVELVVIDSGSTDGGVELLVRLCERYGVELSLSVIRPDEFGHGKTRNLAVRKAKGEIIAILSQDALPVSETWLTDITRPLENPEVAGVFGRQIPRPGTKFCEAFFYEITYPTNPRRMGEDSMASFSNQSLFFSNVNSAIRRSLALENQFREDLVMSEDQFWGRAVLEQGYTIVYEPDAAVLHSHNYSLRELFKRYFHSGYSMRQMDLHGDVLRGGARTAVALLQKVLTERPWYLPYALVDQATQGTGFLCGKHDLLPRRLRDSLLGL